MDPKTVSGILKRKQPLDQNLRQLLLIRHGATDLNDENTSVDRIRGWTDVPLNDEGRKQAQKTGQELRKDPPDGIVASDMGRAVETAQIVSQMTGAPIDGISQAFRPWNVGAFAGQLSKKAVPILANYAAKTPNEKVPEGESFNEFRHRFLSGIATELTKRPQGVVAIVTHHRNERLLHAWQKAGFPPNGDIDHDTFIQKGENTGVSQIFKIPLDRAEAVAQGNHGNVPMAPRSNQPQAPQAGQAGGAQLRGNPGPAAGPQVR